MAAWITNEPTSERKDCQKNHPGRPQINSSCLGYGGRYPPSSNSSPATGCEWSYHGIENSATKMPHRLTSHPLHPWSNVLDIPVPIAPKDVRRPCVRRQPLFVQELFRDGPSQISIAEFGQDVRVRVVPCEPRVPRLSLHERETLHGDQEAERYRQAPAAGPKVLCVYELTHYKFKAHLEHQLITALKQS